MVGFHVRSLSFMEINSDQDSLSTSPEMRSWLLWLKKKILDAHRAFLHLGAATATVIRIFQN